MKIDWKRKLTSRKFWISVAGFATGVILLFTAGVTAQTVTGLIMSLGSVVAYVIGEGMTDAARIMSETPISDEEEDNEG